MSEEIDFIAKEIEKCNNEIENCQKTINASFDVRKYYERRREFLLKIKDLIE